MSHISLATSKTASSAHADFASYLQRTKNTICGRHPIGVLLAAAAELQDTQTPGWGQDQLELKWTRYEQSSACEQVSDSSVSYASAYLKAGE
jgi:predicted class III extradiol MEMO1 family dioxygenase